MIFANAIFLAFHSNALMTRHGETPFGDQRC